MSNSFVAFVIHIGMVFSLVMSRFHLSRCFVYPWSNSFHSSISIGLGCPNFSINVFPLVVMDGGCFISHWLSLLSLWNHMISSCISIDRFFDRSLSFFGISRSYCTHGVNCYRLFVCVSDDGYKCVGGLLVFVFAPGCRSA